MTEANSGTKSYPPCPSARASFAAWPHSAPCRRMSPLPTTVKLRGPAAAALGEGVVGAGGLAAAEAVVAGAVVVGLPVPVAEGERGAAESISGAHAASVHSSTADSNARRDPTLRDVTSAL